LQAQQPSVIMPSQLSMSSTLSAASASAGRKPGLLRILGVGFGIAVIFGGTVGVGILRLPGAVAAQLGNYWLILLAWMVGGLYALLGSISVTELGAMLPQAGGFYVYARRAFGSFAGFAAGWGDWLNNCAVLAYASITAAEYLGQLWRGDLLHHHQTAVALGILAIFTFLQWTGVRSGSGAQKLASSVTAAALLALVVAIFLHSGKNANFNLAGAAPSIQLPAGFFAGIAALVAALRSVIVTYDGWYEAIYFTEEDADPARNLPKIMIGGVTLVIAMYLLINMALLHVLTIPQLAASKLPAADAAQIIFGKTSGQFMVALSLLTLLGLINSVLLGATRIIFAISRDGLFASAAASVSAGGTPRSALLLTSLAAMVLVASATFDRIIAIAAIFFVANYAASYAALLVLRRTAPELPRPFRAWGYPWSTLLVLAGSLLFLAGAVKSDIKNSLTAICILGASAPAYIFMVKRKERLPERPRPGAPGR
jgi:basic amino acid/polyamine antiporter, APA family